MPMTPVKILSDVATSEPGRSVATVAVQGYERYAIPVTYWTELKNDPATGKPSGYGPALAAKCLVKEAAMRGPSMVAASLTKRQGALSAAQTALNALPTAPAAPAPDPIADQRTAIQAQITTLQGAITELTALQTIVQADAVPRIDAFYADLLALIGSTDPRRAQYTDEWTAAKASVTPGPALPATL